VRTEDGYIIQQCLDGNPAAFGFLVDKYKKSVYALAYSEVRNFHDAQDITQEVFIKAYQKLRTLRRWDNFMGWLYRITFNLCKNWLRSRSRRPDNEFAEDQEPAKLGRLFMNSYRENMVYESVREALDSLPEMYRQVLTLRYFGGMTIREMSRFLGVSPGTIDRRLMGARTRLKEEMLVMMSATYEQHELPANLTFRIVETVKWIKIQPMPRMIGLPWGLSFATGLILTVLSLNPNLSFLEPVSAPMSSRLPGETRVMEIGELPADLLMVSEKSIISSSRGLSADDALGALPGIPLGMLSGTLHGEEPDRPDKQNGFSLAPKGQEYVFVRSWPVEILGLRNPNGVTVDGSGRTYVADTNNHRIQVFDSEGNLLKKWGTYGSGDGQFNFPTGVTLDGSGNTYVADKENHRIQVFDSDGNFLKKWGTYGSGDGQFDCPADVAVDGSGNVYVADGYNDRIQVFDSDGNFLKKWGARGSDDGQFCYSNGVAVDGSGNVYVADFWNHRIQVFNSDGKFLRKWGTEGAGNGQINRPEDVAVDSSGHVYVADSKNNRIQKFDSNGDLLKVWGVGGVQFEEPTGIATDGSGNVYVTKYGGNCVEKFDSDGRFLKKWGEVNINGQLYVPLGVALDSSGNVYVTDSGNNCIQKFDSKGNFLKKWGTYGRGNGQFWLPLGIAVDGSGNVYVTDQPTVPDTHRIQKFDSDGKFLKKWGSWGPGDGQLGVPKGLAVDKAGDVYVVEWANCRAQVFDSKGNFIMKWGTQGSDDGQFNCPTGIAVDSSGNVYVADFYNHRIQVFDSDGKFLRKWGTEGSGDGQFNLPEYIAVDSSGKVYVVDSRNHRIQVFDTKGNFLTKWGTYGSGEMEFIQPAGVAVSSSGEIYVADSGNHRIKVYRLIGGGAVEPDNKQLVTWGQVKRTELYQNYPNPFNPETWIPFSLSGSEHVTIRIYSSSGQLVRTLDLGQKPSGTYLSKDKAAYWDGRNEQGEMVASDVYFYVMEAGESTDLRKMVMVR